MTDTHPRSPDFSRPERPATTGTTRDTPAGTGLPAGTPTTSPEEARP